MRAKLLLLLLVFLAVTSAILQAAEAPVARLLRVSLLEGDVTYQRTDLDRIVAPYHAVRAELGQVLHQVVDEAVVVVEDQNLHRSSSWA